MKIIADTHCHTIASTHAYSTILENVAYAKKAGLYAIAITDHARNLPGAPGEWYFENLRVIPREIDGVLVLKGMETNVLDSNGTLDILPQEEDTLEWIVASIHHPATKIPIGDEDACTNAWINIAKDKRVNVIGHSGLEDFKYDYEKVIPMFKENGKLIEINNATFVVRNNSVRNCKRILEVCKKYKAPVILNSDSHFCSQIGVIDNTLKLIEEVDFPQELVVNSSIERFKAYLYKYTKVFD